MSIRIQNDGLAGTAASEASRTQDSVQIGNGAARLGSRADGSSDSVQISSLSGQIVDASNASQAAQANRVSKLTALYQGGRYQVDSLGLSRAMVSQAILAGSAGGD
jgi:anti-sigma28 factor (negative regulator of flagellin synthesis)